MGRTSPLFSLQTLASLTGTALVLGAVGYFFLFGDSVSEEIVVVSPQEFLRQVSVSGKVEPARDVDLGFAQSGRVAKVYVAVGDKVVSGTTLAEIENSDIRALVLQKLAALESEKAKLRALEAGTRPEELAVAEAQVEDAKSAWAQAKQSIVEAIQNAYTASDSAVHITVDQFFSNARTANPKTTISSSNSQVVLDIEVKRAKMETLLTFWQSEAGGITVTSDLEAAVAKAQANLSEVAAFLQTAGTLLSQAVTSQTVSQSSVDAYATAVSADRATINTKISAITTAVTAEKSAAAALNTAEKNLALKKAGARETDIAAQAAVVEVAQAGVADAQAQLKKTVITAPFSGTVTVVNAKVGKSVSLNSVEVSLIGNGAFQVESYVPEINIALLSVDDVAEVTLDAYGDDEVFEAKLLSIDPAETVRDGVSTYRALFTFVKEDARIRAGMTANVVVTTDRRPNIIAVPQGAVLDQDDKHYVRVREGDETKLREVKLGAVSSFGTVEIISGLSSGETVVLPGP